MKRRARYVADFAITNSGLAQKLRAHGDAASQIQRCTNALCGLAHGLDRIKNISQTATFGRFRNVGLLGKPDLLLRIETVAMTLAKFSCLPS